VEGEVRRTELTSARADVDFWRISSRWHVFAPSLLDTYRYAEAPVELQMQNAELKSLTVCTMSPRRDVRLCVRSEGGDIRILPNVLYTTWAGKVRGTAVSAENSAQLERMAQFPAWRDVLNNTQRSLMRIKDGIAVPTDHPNLVDSDAFAVVVAETEEMSLQVVDVRVDGHSFPFVLRRDKDTDLRKTVLEQCDWRVHTLLSKLDELPPIVDGVMEIDGGE
jgi:hypothetical protein